MNHITNDKGQTVIADGADGSIARVRIQYPALIERLNCLHDGEARIDQAINAIRQAGIRSEMETNNIIAASQYGQNPDVATQLVIGVARTNLQLFLDTYRHFLGHCRQAYPEQYVWPVSETEAVFARMENAIKRGSYNKDGKAFALTCRHLNIPHTYKAINAFISL